MRVKLAALLEKHPLQTGYSKVSFPRRTQRILEFHLPFVKPAIRGVTSRPDGNEAACGLAAGARGGCGQPNTTGYADGRGVHDWADPVNIEPLCTKY
jgi:hypothetical protein